MHHRIRHTREALYDLYPSCSFSVLADAKRQCGKEIDEMSGTKMHKLSSSHEPPPRLRGNIKLRQSKQSRNVPRSLGNEPARGFNFISGTVAHGSIFGALSAGGASLPANPPSSGAWIGWRPENWGPNTLPCSCSCQSGCWRRKGEGGRGD
ncbi:hypothetical protein GQ53DRAFT_412744 [Thozetella sp. PMI_491]|nr:hypothetical protein GQ53DRAFT_412744 [Thozetella sp. PMI_491]